VYILSGLLPVEAQIHIRALGLFNNICNQAEDSVEKTLARRQVCTLLGMLFLSAGKVFALSFVFEIVLAVPVVLLSVLLIPYHIIRLA
jgi:hypothetical protein